MRKLLGLVLTLLLATAAGAATLTETVDRTFDVRIGAKVALSNVNGSITVSSWDQPRVRVLAYKEVEGDRREAQDAMKELRVEFQQRDGGLNVITHYPKESNGGSIFDWLLGDDVDAEVKYELTVPRTMNVDVTNTNGSIRISDVAGQHELDTTNGRIRVERCAGAVEASTTNGSIEAELLRVSRGQPMRFETTNGRIIVTVPRDLGAEVDARTTNGSISSDLPVTTTKIGSNRLQGTINGGGTPLRLRTTNGGIEIRTSGKS